MNETTILATTAPTLPELVLAHCHASPDHTAIVAADRRFSYGELADRVDDIAATLRGFGMRPGMPVAVLMERSADLPACLLAVLAVGGVCVPLDPHHPVERGRFILSDCGARFLITNVDSELATTPELTVLDIRTSPPHQAGGASVQRPEIVADPLMYYLYTSGSTGRPKGVMLTQRGVLNVMFWAQEYFGIGPGDVVLQRTTFTFDISLLELFAPLIAGATVVLLAPQAQLSPAAVRESIVAHGVGLVQFTPSALATHISALDGDPLPGVARCLVAGEPLKTALRDDFYRITGDCTLYNLYGPTETSIYTTACEVPRSGPISVGVPLPNTWIDIRSESGATCAPGEPGELWIGGVGVARGYLNKDELTAQRFVSDVFRSGDLGIRLADGQIDLRGRLDHQVKIRGFRIELGEVENALTTTPGVTDGVVVVADPDGSPELAAYWIGNGDARSIAENLRRTLPGYMIPTHYIHMSEFPLTGSGKIDRNALPAPGTGTETDGPHTPPRDDTDQALCALFEQCLGRTRVGIDDSFLDLGGDSLKAAVLARRVRDVLGRPVEIAHLLADTTIRALADEAAVHGTAGESAPIAAVPVAPWYPLSSGQRSLWMLAQGGAPHAAFVEPLVYQISGQLDSTSMRGALQGVLDRHEALRTAIVAIDHQPMQRPVLDYRLDWTERQFGGADELDDFLAEFVTRDFDLERGELFRAALVRLDTDQHVLAIAMHHIATDGWSLTVLIEEILSRYSRLRAGTEPAEEPIALQYKDFAVWQQRTLLTGSSARTVREYWLSKLGGDLERLELPTDRPRPPERSFRGATAQAIVPQQVLDLLRLRCRESSATLFAGLLAAVRVLLYRYTGQRDFAIGTSVLGRPRGELDSQVGYFVNAVALRDNITSTTTFQDLLGLTRSTVTEALRHGDYPFDRVVDDLRGNTPHDRNPLFDVMVMIDPGWGDPGSPPEGLRVEQQLAPNAHSKMDLTLFLKETDKGLRVLAEYSADIFDADRIDRMLAHFTTMLADAVARPDVAVADLALLAIEERRRVLAEFNDTAVDFGPPVPVHRLFAQQADMFPDRTAVVDRLGARTYGELAAEAEAIAWLLVHRYGVRRGDRVALMLDRSARMVAAVLGVLEAGATYMPVSTTDPAERVRSLIEDGVPCVVLVDDPEIAMVKLGPGAPPTLDVGPSVSLPRVERGWDRPEVSLADAAYCIFTSGSTGRPKGVVVEHAALFNRLAWMREGLALCATDTFLVKTPYNFDVSVWEILLPGTVGARQIVLDPGGERDPETIRTAMDDHAVTVVHFVPSMLAEYLTAVPGGGFDGVRHCVTSGEALPDDLAATFCASAPTTDLHNFYGPTEATIDVSWARIKSDTPVTIGRPTPNTRLYVLDSAGQPAPIGITGELCISGVQLARGYLGSPGRTAVSFVADPFANGRTLYRTGDSARWTADGRLQYLGRRDDQIKLRGFRIELGEIEHVLRAVDGVGAAVVLLDRTAEGTEFLKAFVTAEAGIDGERLRRLAARLLPAHMIPAQLLVIDAIPVTANGKADRRALATLSAPRAERRADPVSPVERELLALWRTILPEGDLYTDDDFFTKGGDSISALRLRSRITERFGVTVRLSALFTRRTVADQADHIDELRRSGQVARRTLCRYPRRDRHPLSAAQERVWFLQQLAPESAAYNISLLCHLSGSLNLAAFERAVVDLVARHEILRTTYTRVGDQVFQTVCTDYTVPFAVLDDGDPAVTARAIAASPFDVATELPLRVRLLRQNPREHHLLVVLHHLAGDGSSMQLLARELSALYGFHTGAVTERPAEPGLQYIDYVESERIAHSSERTEHDLEYWTVRLSGVPRLELATDPAPQAPVGAGRTYATMGTQTSQALRELATARSVTLFEIAISALDLLLSRLSGQDDIALGFPISNRHESELDSIVGLFLNTLVLRADLTAARTFAELLARVSTDIHEAYDHQSAPFELIVERLNPPRNVGRTPIFDVLVNFQNDMRADMSFHGVDVEFRSHEFAVDAKFAMVFYFVDDGEHVHVELAYRRDLFAAERAEAIVGQLMFLLDQIAADPDRELADYSLRVPGSAGCDADLAVPLPVPTPRRALDAVAEHAQARPNLIAIEHGTDSVTYYELSNRVATLARHLVESGVGGGRVVVVTGPPGIGFVVGLLAALRAGAIVLPLDPELPLRRRDHLIAIARPAVSVVAGNGPAPTQAAHRVDPRTGLLISPPAPAADAALEGPPPDAPAYIFFTSGTTGAPRAVLGGHRGLDHFLSWQSSTFEVGPGDRCAQLTRASFDVVLRDILLPLVSGATLVVPRESDRYDGRAMLTWFAEQRITAFHAVPTVLQSWLSDLQSAVSLPALRWVFLAGEPLKAHVVEAFRARCAGASRIVNLYGPTETTLAKLAHVVDDSPLPTLLPVGTPLPDTQVLIRRAATDCGVGEPGEVLIRTPLRSHGYYRDPAATAAAFVVNPHRDDPEDLLYHTGDIGRLRPDGRLEIIGRADDQIKINGVRIQPAEVESAVSAHPAVEQCVVRVDRLATAPALTAYVVSRLPHDSVADVLRDHLADRLPLAMLPRSFVAVDRIPTTPNGKPDRAALPAAEATVTPTHQQPRSATEAAIQEVWAAVLNRAAPGVTDDFFELGGTSLKLLHLYSTLSERFPGVFNVTHLFSRPTIAGQAALVTPVLSPTPEVVEHDF
ncbi:amino acid adenylation domain-containing protein [Nocardia sp. NPDC005745]|uniref:non-ribosomal peptide synthetase n=1 Tax=Nocardia sp. NPDC005745 TaxID=3157061 RepID=UPI0033DB5C77